MSDVTSIEIQGVTVLRVRPSADSSIDQVRADLARELTSASEHGGESVIADLGNLPLDLPVLVDLERAHDTLAKAGHRLLIVSGNDEVRESIRAHGTLVCAESLDIAAGDLASANDPTASPADRERRAIPPLDARGY